MKLVNGNFPSDFVFDGKIKAEFFEDDKLIATHISNLNNIKYHKIYKSVVNNIVEIDKISLLSFEIPIEKKYSKNLNVRITVIDADAEMKQYAENIQLYIGIDRTL